MKRRVYLAGPMSGVARMNFPAFDEASEALRGRGYDVVSPAELDSSASRAAALAIEDGDITAYTSHTGETWADLLARDVKLLTDKGIEGVVVLPGWQGSRGALLETFVARLNDLPIYHYGPLDPLRQVTDMALAFYHGELQLQTPKART